MEAEGPTTSEVSLTEDQEIALTAAAVGEEDIHSVTQRLIDEQADILRTDQRNAHWHALTAEQQEAALVAGEAVSP